MPHVIRSLGRDDAGALSAIADASDAFAMSARSRFFDPHYLERWLSDPGEDILVAAFDGTEIVGFVLCEVLRGSWAHWHSIFVRPDRRRSGIGTALFGAVYERLRAKGVEYCTAYVRDARLAEFLETRGGLAGRRFTFWEWSVAR